jgi:hypothetical protein
MKLKIIRIFIFLLIFSVPLGLFGSDLVGYRHDGVRFREKLPNGAQDLGGGLLSDEAYGVTRFKKGNVYMLWLERIISRNRSSVPRWEVRDVLSFKTLKRNQEFLFSYSSPCRLNGRENLDLIVFAELSPRTKNPVPVKAWIADVNEEKFRSIPVKGISCR